jgi:hypothetical protein
MPSFQHNFLSAEQVERSITAAKQVEQPTTFTNPMVVLKLKH